MSPNVLAQPALLGKLPAQADFVRVNAQAPVFHAFHRWLEESVEALGTTQTALPGRVRFLFVAQDGSGALAGVMSPSRDQIGRAFPLAVLLPLDEAKLAQGFSALPDALGPFFAAASQVLERAGELGVDALAEKLSGLPSLGADALTSSLASSREALGRATPADLKGLFERGGHWYALRTFLLACDAERRGQAPKGGPVSVECPLSAQFGAGVWLELAARRARWRSPPSFLWSETKLLLTLGSTASASLIWFCRPSSSAVKLWPLRTTSDDAVASARSALPMLHDALERPDGTLEAVWAALEAAP